MIIIGLVSEAIRNMRLIKALARTLRGTTNIDQIVDAETLGDDGSLLSFVANQTRARQNTNNATPRK